MFPYSSFEFFSTLKRLSVCFIYEIPKKRNFRGTEEEKSFF